MKVARKRIAIAADTLTSSTGVKIPSIPKTEAVFRVLGRASALSCQLANHACTLGTRQCMQHACKKMNICTGLSSMQNAALLWWLCPACRARGGGQPAVRDAERACAARHFPLHEPAGGCC